MKCDYCVLEAVVNYQKIWTKFEINKNGKYKQSQEFNPIDIEEPIGGDNIDLCEEHEKSWLEEKI